MAMKFWKRREHPVGIYTNSLTQKRFFSLTLSVALIISLLSCGTGTTTGFADELGKDSSNAEVVSSFDAMSTLPVEEAEFKDVIIPFEEPISSEVEASITDVTSSMSDEIGVQSIANNGYKVYQEEADGSLTLLYEQSYFGDAVQWVNDHAVEGGSYVVEVTADDPGYKESGHTSQAILSSLKSYDVTIRSSIGEQYTITASPDPLNPTVHETMLYLSGAINVTLENIILDGNGTDGGVSFAGLYESATTNYSDAGVLTLGDGAVIKNAVASYGAGVYVSTGELVMEEGSAIINCNATSAGGAVGVTGATATSSLSSKISKFTMNGGVIGGEGQGNNAAYGGGIFGQNAIITITGDSVISHNVASTYGGGICYQSQKADCTVELGGNATINDNSVTGSYASGGGVCVVRASGYSGFTIDFNLKNNASIASNYASGQGGGLYLANTVAQIGMSSSDAVSIENNSAGTFGGGAIVWTDGSLTANSARFTGNTAVSGGGGLYAAEQATLTDCEFTSNSTTGSSTGGGSLRAGNAAAVSVSDCVIQQSEAPFGAGAFASTSGSIEFQGASTIVGNTALISGGGVYATNSSSVVMSGLSIISGNTASSSGGGIFLNSASFVMQDSGSSVGNPAVYNNISNLSLNDTNAAGDDLFSSGSNTSVTLLAGSDMSLHGVYDWYYDEANARYRAGDSSGVYTLVNNDTSALALTLGGYALYYLTFDPGAHGTMDPDPHSVSLAIGESVSLGDIPVISAASGYAFVGWNVEEGGISKGLFDNTSLSNLPITSDTVATAYYVPTSDPNACTLCYDGNGSTSGTMSDETTVYGQSYTLTANQFAKTGYSFKSWNTQPDGSGVSYADGETFTIEGDMVLYAQWGVVDPGSDPGTEPGAGNESTLVASKSGTIPKANDGIRPYLFLLLGSLVVVSGMGTLALAKNRTRRSYKNTQFLK